MITLGIDVGTTHTKVLALDVDEGRTLALESAATPVVHEAAGEAHSATDVLETVLELLTVVVRRLPDRARVQALCVASVGEEVVLLDATGAPVGDAITWYDPRGFAEAAAYMAGPGGDLPLRGAGHPTPRSLSSSCSGSAPTSPAPSSTRSPGPTSGTMCSTGSAPSWSWTGHMHHEPVPSTSSSAPGTRPPSRLAELDLDFPRLVPGRTVIGTLDADLTEHLGLQPGVALVSGGHDHLCAAYGAGVRSTRELFLSAGTSEAHLSLLEAPLEGEAATPHRPGLFRRRHELLRPHQYPLRPLLQAVAPSAVRRYGRERDVRGSRDRGLLGLRVSRSRSPTTSDGGASMRCPTTRTARR